MKRERLVMVLECHLLMNRIVMNFVCVVELMVVLMVIPMVIRIEGLVVLKGIEIYVYGSVSAKVIFLQPSDSQYLYIYCINVSILCLVRYITFHIIFCNDDDAFSDIEYDFEVFLSQTYKDGYNRFCLLSPRYCIL